ncbi:hypothetical protein B0H14DRAFT_1185164 [Mycena olivaceomarginata]|nr:hypothetical protein B0H14DRAFT_1185164 [Mycena olivaceomarginata]
MRRPLSHKYLSNPTRSDPCLISMCKFKQRNPSFISSHTVLLAVHIGLAAIKTREILPRLVAVSQSNPASKLLGGRARGTCPAYYYHPTSYPHPSAFISADLVSSRLISSTQKKQCQLGTRGRASKYHDPTSNRTGTGPPHATPTARRPQDDCSRCGGCRAHSAPWSARSACSRSHSKRPCRFRSDTPKQRKTFETHRYR